MGPKGDSECAFSAAAILGRVWLIFLDQIEGAGVANCRTWVNDPLGGGARPLRPGATAPFPLQPQGAEE